MTVICAIHDINQAIKYSDNILVLKNGKIKHFGQPQKIITTKMIKDTYGIQSKIYNNADGIHVDFLYD